jgi:hypothetical protein
MQLIDRPNGTFTTQEVLRLAAYRAAVAAGFFTDWDGSATSTDTEVLAWLPRANGAVDSHAYPFTPEERRRLETLKAAVADKGGRYADDRPPATNLAAPHSGDARATADDATR